MARAAMPRRRGRCRSRTVADEIVAEIDGSLTAAQTDELARRHGLARLQSRIFRSSAPASACSVSPTGARWKP